MRRRADVRRQIAASLAVTRDHGCQLIVNDYWREAIDAGADYVHLGQEDLAGADRDGHQGSGRAPRHLHPQRGGARRRRSPREPDYVALGPIYETKLKAMQWAPQGLERIGPGRRGSAD